MPTKPDASALLKADHHKVEELFEKFEKARDTGRKKALANEICMELSSMRRLRRKSSNLPARAGSKRTCTGACGWLGHGRLADMLLARKEQLEEKFKNEGLPPPTTRSFRGQQGTTIEA